MHYLIFGGTGTLGSALVKQLTKAGVGEITVFSRGEHKQQEMKKKYPHVRYIIGDVRDRQAVRSAYQGVGADTVFHCAALKHVDVVEHNPKEGVMTNIIGTFNVVEEAEGASFQPNHFIFSSTDKAVLPINVYGNTKAICERFVLDRNSKPGQLTKYSVFRWGNVLGSNGSVIHAFVKSLKERNEILVTHKDMTRFWINIDDAAAFMIERYKYSKDFDVNILPHMKGASVQRMAQAVAAVLGIEGYKTVYVGKRPGEKIHECIESNHEYCINSNTVEQLSDEELYAMVERAMISELGDDN